MPWADQGAMWCSVSAWTSRWLPAVHANTQAGNAGADANTALPEVQANAGEQFQGAVKSESHIRIDCSGK
jgi:hypothetical protein